MKPESHDLCKLCLQNKKLIKAHIIPEGFFRVLRSGDLAPELYTNTPGTHPKRFPVGECDLSILCSSCDNTLAPWDTYAQDVLLQQLPSARTIVSQDRTVARIIDEFDYQKLKLFFISLLWPASVSTRSFYKRISVEPFEEQLRTMILAGKPGGPDDFAVLLGRFEDPEVPAMLDPHRQRFEGISFCQFYLAGVVAYIKVDQRPTPTFWTDFRLRENAALLVVARSLNSKDGKLLRSLAESAMAYRAMKNKVAKVETE